jgi:N-acylneuraminate cytidylyltransferase
MNDKTVAVILARGGSKGIPNKNIMTIKNRPLLFYTIQTAIRSGVDEVWVSTDCSNIKWVAEQSGARVLDRPEKYAKDVSSSEEALLHFAENVDFDVLVFIQPTSPLLKSTDLSAALELMDTNDYDSIFSVYREHWVPRWSLDNKPILWDTDRRPRRQDMTDMFVENGAFYITKRDDLLKSGLRYSGKIGTYEMPQSRSFQIDTMDDVYIIEKLLGDC